MQAFREPVRRGGFVAVGEDGAVPGRVGGAVAKLPELRRFDHRRGGGGAIGGETFDGGTAEARGGGRRMRQERES